jgi:nucleoside-diphosphate-sugar epimerase
MKTAIVSGAAGFMGYHLIRKLRQKGVRVVALCRPGSPNNVRLDEFEGLEIIECDASEYLHHTEEIKKYSPDVFYHLAWNGTTGEKRMDYAVQLADVKETCDAYACAAAAGCRKFVASGTVYELLTEQILALKDFSASSYYVIAKQFAYESLFQLSKKVGLDFTWCMICQPIGRYIKLNQLTAYLITELKNGRVPKLGTAENPFDMIVADDLASGFYLAGETVLSQKRYYVGSGHPRMLKEYLNEECRIVAPEQKLVFGERADDGLRFSYEWLDSSAFMKETGFSPESSFEEGVREVEKWIEECQK